jgi:hypothetical protein
MQDSMRPEDTDGLTQTDEAERSADRLSVRPTVRPTIAIFAAGRFSRPPVASA